MLKSFTYQDPNILDEIENFLVENIFNRHFLCYSFCLEIWTFLLYNSDASLLERHINLICDLVTASSPLFTYRSTCPRLHYQLKGFTKYLNELFPIFTIPTKKLFIASSLVSTMMGKLSPIKSLLSLHIFLLYIFQVFIFLYHFLMK